MISFQPPSLADRTFDDLVEDMLRRIPAHTPEWTHPRLGDPGRTLIELFAWLGDALLYRANLVPERQRLVFLKLLGLPLKSAQPARTIVSLAWAQPTELSAATLAAGRRIAGAQLFETLTETTVLPITAEAYVKRALNDRESAKLADVIDGLTRVHRIRTAARPYETTPVFDGGRAVPAGVDVFGGTADRALWLALLAPAAPKEQDQPAANEAALKALGGGDSGAASLLSVGIVPAVKTPALFEEIGARARVPVVWEITTRGRTANATDYLTLEPLAGNDTTAGLARPGTLRLPLPDESLIWAPSNDVQDNPAAGVGDVPPRLDDAQKASRLVAWLRLRPAPGQQVNQLKLAWLGVNAVEVDQRVTLGGRVLGVSSGAADQAFQLPERSVDPDTLEIEVEEPGRGYQRWSRVEDLAAIHPDPQVARDAGAYELDAAGGVIRFGDGVRGRAPEREMRIRLARGRFGGGRAGNVPAGTLAELSAVDITGKPVAPIKVSQPLPAEGGEDIETLAAAEKRIPSYLAHRDRAVTADDYKSLAFEAPGITVGRVDVLPRFKPRDRRFDVPGVVSVLALPMAPLSRAPNPRPDRPFIERLHAHLSARTPLSTELYVIGCEYVPLAISVGVAIRDGHARDQVLDDVKQALIRLLWPLAPGGIDAEGWPLGRDVTAGELVVDVSRVAGVREVRGLRLFRRDANAGDDWREVPDPAGVATAKLDIAAWQLPELLGVVVTDDPSGAPSRMTASPNPYADPRAVAVPVVPRVC
ncbi:MAG TPA: putative baseplate assembly protein [Burkholderiales bacterium]|nr:putative baseplate assembly protein [Burkholderiales bacterium]